MDELIDLSLENTRSTSTPTPISGSALACSNMLLIKTTISPIVRFNSMKKVKLTDGKLMVEKDNHQTYILLPYKNMDYETQPGQTTKLIGRNCVIDRSIEARSTYSPGSFAEIIKFQTFSAMSIDMSCSRHDSPNTTTWIIMAGSHELKLPLDCSIMSSGINCSSVTFTSTMAGAGTKGENSTSYFNLAMAELKSSSSAFQK